MLRRTFTAVCAALCVAGAGTVRADEKGFFGLSLAVELDGTPQAPTLREAKVVKVLTGSPAAGAGIQRGDVIVEVEGRAIVGGNAYEFDRLMKKNVGEPLRLRLQRGSAAPYAVTLVAVIGRPE